MRKGLLSAGTGAALIAAGVWLAPAQAGGPEVTVSNIGSNLNIHMEGSTQSTIQVLYLAGPEDWQIVGNFVTAGSGCDQVSSAEVTCAENGEDIDFEFGSTGGSVTMVGADSFLDFNSDIQLGVGSDIVIASDGDDVIHADATSTNNDDIDSLDGDDDIETSNGSDIIDGGDDNDTIVAGNGNNFVNGGEFAGDDTDGDDTITGGSIIDDLDGGAGTDILNGGDDGDEITGGDGNDTINAGPGDDGETTQGVDGQDGNDTVNGEAGDDTLAGGADTDTLNGGANEDILDPGAGTDTVNGDGENDLMRNSDGADAFNGGSGSDDEVDYTPTSAAAMTIDIDGAADDGRNCPGGSCEGDNVGTTTENVTGDSSADVITGSSSANDLDGAGGNDTLSGGAGAGADGGDQFVGGSETDTVTYDPAGGTPRTGALTVDIDGTADDGTTGELDDVETTVENVTGGSGADNITGSTANNQLRGGPGTANDTLSGNTGDDTLFGGTGINTGTDGADVFNGDGHTNGDTVSYAGRTDAITADLDGAADDGASGENDDINTTVENITGGSAADTLTGNASNNVLDGGGNNDTLRGGTTATGDGNDSLVGNTGTGDTADYSARNEDLDLDADGVADDGFNVETDNIATTTENVTGGSADDDINGTTAANVLTGGAGDDDLAGGIGAGPDGADTYNGGTHGTVGGQNGDDGDFADYGTRTDNLVIDIGGGANDGAGGCPSGAGCEDDDVQVTIERLIAGDGDDTLTGSAANNTFLGNEGDDLMRGGTGTGPDGADSFAGGNLGETNGDTVSYTGRTDDIVASQLLGGANGGGGCPSGAGCEDDSIDGSTDNITGGSGNDALSGNSSDNVLSGGAGNDTLAGSFNGTGPDGADRFLAGAPVSSTIDTVTYASRDDDITADIGGGSDDEDGDDISADIDNVTGGDGDDSLFGDADVNRIDGAGGDDVLAGGQGTGPDGADTFIGGTDSTVGGAHSTLKDLVTYFSRTDDVSANLTTGVGPDGDVLDPTLERLTGGGGDDNLTGDAEANRLEGNNGDDFLAGGTSAGPDGNDIFVGGGNTAVGDAVSYAVRTDSITATTGSGPVNGGGDCPGGLTCEDDDIQSTVENLTGGSNDDALTGDADPNTLNGGDGEDTLSALAGIDRVEARDGFADTIDCGTQADTAVLDEGALDVLTPAGTCETLDQPPLQAPETTILTGPDNPTPRRKAKFTFEADEAATFQCKIDNKQFRNCTSPKEYRNLDPGRHKVQVVATDLVGQTDATPDKYRWRITN